jgi:hypothetical protein
MNNDKYRSLVGGILSLVTSTLIILLFWKAFVDLIMMKTFTVKQIIYKFRFKRLQGFIFIRLKFKLKCLILCFLL